MGAFRLYLHDNSPTAGYIAKHGLNFFAGLFYGLLDIQDTELYDLVDNALLQYFEDNIYVQFTDQMLALLTDLILELYGRTDLSFTAHGKYMMEQLREAEEEYKKNKLPKTDPDYVSFDSTILTILRKVNYYSIISGWYNHYRAEYHDLGTYIPKA